MPAHVVDSWRQKGTNPGGGGAVGRGRIGSNGEPPLGSLVPEAVRNLRLAVYGRLARFPGTVFDGGIVRDRNPTYYRPHYMPPGDNQPSWTAAGPARPTLHMRQATYRQWAGSSASRFPFVPSSPTGGLHSDTPHAVPRTRKRYQATPQMVGAGINRLSPSRYHGQTYSAQTTVLGGKR